MRRCLVDLVGGHRCDREVGHDGRHSVAGRGVAVDPAPVVRLTDAQWRVMSALSVGERVVVPPITRQWLTRRRWIRLVGDRNRGDGFVITEEGRTAFGRAIRIDSTGR